MFQLGESGEALSPPALSLRDSFREVLHGELIFVLDQRFSDSITAERVKVFRTFTNDIAFFTEPQNPFAVVTSPTGSPAACQES